MSLHMRPLVLVVLAVSVSTFMAHSLADAPSRDRGPSSTCDGLWFNENIHPDFSTAAAYEASPGHLTTSQPVGRYAIHVEGGFVPALDLNYPGDVLGASDFEVVSASGIDDASVEKIQQATQVQHYVESLFVGAREMSADDYRALQVAMWIHLGDLTMDTLSPDEKVTIDKGQAQFHLDAISSMPTSAKSAPRELWARLDTAQPAGQIQASVMVTDLGGERLTAERVEVSNELSSEVALTSTEPIALALPNPLRGHQQSIKASWKGELPAGSLLRGTYTEPKEGDDAEGDTEAEDDSTDITAYLVTTQSIPLVREQWLRRGANCS